MDREEWDRRYASAELVWTAGPNRFVAEELPGLVPGAALDLAAGEGRNAIWLAERGWRVTALDFSAVALGKGRRIAAERGAEVDWVEADVRAYVPPAEAYDLVLIAYLHLPSADFAGVLHRAVDAVSPGGTLFLIGHDRSNLTEGYGGPSDPDVLYAVDELTAGLTGLRIERAERVTRPTGEDTPDAIDTLVRAVRA
ncbi:MAG: methyltransferase domain-containing protein [Streptosporangiales bacterium]|nr:methyltransferase domain-containing protein [Streptosporangiales bacterium]